MTTSGFLFARTPQLYFRAGALDLLADIIKKFGTKVAIVTGGSSFSNSPRWHSLTQQLEDSAIAWKQITIDSEPTPAMVDNAVLNLFAFLPDVVVAIGGGSVLDAGKAISAMFPLKKSVRNYLEGIGTEQSDGKKLPFIAVPTTAGTGSEAAKNAVLSEPGPNGFKRSLRHDNFVPDFAILDPLLAVSCPPSVTAASGMDAFTQLLESYVSTASNPVTDALAFEGLRQVSKALVSVYHDPGNVELRTNMALAAYLSGITLTNAGLGMVHGFASTIGGYYKESHGVICSALMWPTNVVTVRKLRADRTNTAALEKYAAVGKLFAKRSDGSDDFFIDLLLNRIEEMRIDMKIRTLKELQLEDNIQRIAVNSDSKNNPVKLNNEEKIEILTSA